MNISAITIENFKSIKDPVRIELKPITLLFGQNSVGKSTIIQALHYAREVMRGSGVDIDHTETGGDYIQLGGFANVVHNHDLKNVIRLKFELDVPNVIRNNPDEVEYSFTEFDSLEEEYPDEVKRIKQYYREQLKHKMLPWFELDIKQDSVGKKPYISLATIGFGENSFLKVCVYSSKEVRISYLDLDHPIFPVIGGKSLTKALSLHESSLFMLGHHFDLIDIARTQSLGADPFPGEQGIFRMTHVNRLPEVIFFIPKPNLQFAENGYLVKPEFLKGVKQKSHPFKDPFNFFENLLNAIWSIHFNAVKEDLQDFRYIGPLRDVPELTSDAPKEVKANRWAKGLAAWDRMSTGSEWDLEVVNKWLSQEYFNAGYKVVRQQYKELELNSPLYNYLAKSSKLSGKGSVKRELDNLPTRYRLFLRSVHNNIKLQPKDIGVGVSQVLPIIPLSVTGSHDHDGMIAIEQPELHIHPAMQVVLGDLFIVGLLNENNKSGRKRFLLETHSEHLLLRLLRRIREPSGEKCKLSPDDLGIYYLEAGLNGVQVNQMHVDNDGEFQDEWPNGFFEEREDELL